MSKKRLIIGIISITFYLICNFAYADFRVTGIFQYEDRTFDISGCTGTEDRPIREADVLVYDNSSGSVIAEGKTDLNGRIVDTNGEIGILVSTNNPINILVCAITRTRNTSDLSIEVRDSDNQDAVYGVYSDIYSNWFPNENLDIGTRIAPAIDNNLQSKIGAAFNLFDCAINGLDYIKYLQNQSERPTTSPNGHNHDPFLIINYGENIVWAYFNGQSINMNSSFGYSDNVIYHEMGHWVQDHFSKDSHPGGSHSLYQEEQNPGLSYGEGWASFWNSAVMQYKGIDLYPSPIINVQLNGADGTGWQTLRSSFEVEEGKIFNISTRRLNDNPIPVSGSRSEVVVTKVLWDIMDNGDTKDFTVGTDDDELALADNNIWDTFLNLKDAVDENEFITIEDFWDCWFIRNNHLEEMEKLFRINGMHYYEDNLENNNELNIGESSEYTLYPSNDEDWFLINADINKEYYITTQAIGKDTDTYIEIYDNSMTLIKQNDNMGTSLNSYMRLNPDQNGPYYIKIRHSPNAKLKYGKYKILLEEAPRRQNNNDNILTVSCPEGEGEYFSIQRAMLDAEDGDTILFIDSSTFNEQVVIYGFHNITIKNKDGCRPIVKYPSGRIVSIENSQNITIDGLTIEGAYENSRDYNMNNIGIFIGDDSKEIIIQNCEVKNNSIGIKFLCYPYNISDRQSFHSRIIKGRIYNNSTGIWLVGGRHLVEKNYIYKNQKGLSIDIRYGTYSNEREFECNQININSNYIFENKGDGIGVDSRKASCSLNIVNNLIAFNKRDNMFLFVDKNIKIDLINNTIAHAHIKAIDIWGDVQLLRLRAYNCILTNRVYPEEILNNFMYSVLPSEYLNRISGNNNLFTDPLFVNVGASFNDSDFRLRGDSPCIDAGTIDIDDPETPWEEQLPQKDIELNKRNLDGNLDGNRVTDIGAYEYRNPLDRNHPPEILLTENPFVVSENQILRFTVQAQDSDGDSLTYRWENLPRGANANQTGEFSWQPDFNQAGEYEIIIVVSDGELEDRRQVMIEVKNTNRRPVISPLVSFSIREGERLRFNVQAQDPDGDTLKFTLQNAPSGASINADTGQFEWTPGFNQAGTYNINILVTDGYDVTAGYVTINIIDAKPNLSITKVGTYTLSNPASGRNNIPNIPITMRMVSLKVINNGYKDISANEGFSIAYKWQNGRYLTKIRVNKNIPKGSSIIVEIQLDWKVYPLKFKVDCDNNIAETKEDDNEYSQYIPIAYFPAFPRS